MKMFKKIALLGTMLAASVFANANDEPTKIGWTHFITWEGLGVMQEMGIVDKYNKQNGTNVEMVYIGDYIDSITLYSDKKLAGVAATTMDVLAFAGVGKRHSEVTVVTDTSHGGDAIMIRGYDSLAAAADAGATVNLVEFSVSHYLLARCSEIMGVDFNDFELENAKVDATIPTTLAAKSQFVGVTWNPILETVKGLKGANEVCNSSQAEGEIMDTILTGNEVTEAEKKTIRQSWAEISALMAAGDPEVLAAMAKQAGTDVASIKRMLAGVKLMATPAQEAEFVNNSANIKRIMDKVTHFSFNEGVWDAIDSVDELGIRYADGTTSGDSGNVVLTFPKK